jgi:hypothetical protein
MSQKASDCALNTPYRIIQDALGSPGCTRAVMTAKVLVSVGVESDASERKLMCEMTC